MKSSSMYRVKFFIVFFILVTSILFASDGNAYISYKLPAEMEERAGAYDEFVKDLNLGNHDIAIQQKGLNSMTEASTDYARILISYEPSGPDSMGMFIDAEDSELLYEVDEFMAMMCSDSGYYRSWDGCSYTTIAGRKALVSRYTRYSTSRNKDDVKVAQYYITVNGYDYTITMSNRVTNDEKWAKIFSDFLSSVSFPDDIVSEDILYDQNIPGTSLHYLWMREPEWNSHMQTNGIMGHSFLDLYSSPDGSYFLQMTGAWESIADQHFTTYLKKQALKELRLVYLQAIEEMMAPYDPVKVEDTIDSWHFILEYHYRHDIFEGISKVYGLIENDKLVVVYYEGVGNQPEVKEIADSILVKLP